MNEEHRLRDREGMEWEDDEGLPPQTAARRSILVVDDNPFIRNMFRKHLERAGFAVSEAEDGQEALRRLERAGADVVLLDVNMPRMDGLECLSGIRERDPRVQVIMVTGETDVKIGVSAMKRGAMDYLVKPVKRDELLDIIGKAIENRDSIREKQHFVLSHALLLNNAGIVLFHRNLNPRFQLDEDIFGGMFTAIKMFIDQSLRIDGGLKNIEQGDYNILIEEGKNFYLAVIGQGEDVEAIRDKMKRSVERINHRYSEILARWQGDMSEVKDIDREFENLLFYEITG